MTNRTVLEDAIKKQTQLPWDGKKVKYFKLKAPDQSTIDRQINERRIKPPKNMELLESGEPCNVNSPPVEYTLNEHEIEQSIQIVNGGVNYSNEFYEHYWKMKQMQLSDEAHINDKTEYANNNTVQTSDIKNDKENKSNDDTENKENFISAEEIIKQCRLSKNAAIKGLLKSNKITVNDLQVPSQCNSKSKTTNASTTEQCNMKLGGYLVEHPECSDVFIHQAFGKLDESNHKSTDFRPSHIGTKKIVTPRKYYIDDIDDESFTFVKTDKKAK